MRFKSVKFKISILYTTILGIILIVYSGLMYFSLNKTLNDDLDAVLIEKTQKITEKIYQYLRIIGEDDDSLLFAVRRMITLKGKYADHKKSLTAQQKEQIQEIEKGWFKKYDKLDLGVDYIYFKTRDGQPLVKSRNISPEFEENFLKKTGDKTKDKVSFAKLKIEKKNLRFIQAPFILRGEPKYILQIGTSQKPIIEILENRQSIIMVSIPVILILTSFVGRFLTEKILIPVKEITSTAKNITYQDLTRRIKTKDVDEEMHLLVEAFNDMIARLENSFEHIAEFSSQVSHELKTPLAIIRGEMELALRKDRNPEEYKRVLRIGVGEIKRLLKTIEDLLLLAKLDYRPEIFKFAEFDMNKFFQEIFWQTKILASDKEVEVQMSLPEKKIIFNGDSLHLRRLFFNIVHNAIKFTPNHGEIKIVVKQQSREIVTTISDTGVGISPEDLPKIFDRFFHVEKPEQSAEPGNGLGLNIAHSIAKVHKGRIEVQSRANQGTTFTITLPNT